MSDNIVREVSEASIIQAVPTGLREFLSSVIDCDENGIYYDPDCPFCNSPHRASAEQTWRNGDPYDKSRIQKMMTHFSSRGETMGREMILYHCASHLDAGVGELKKKALIRKLDNMSGVRLTTLDRLELAMNAISERILSAGAISAEPGTSEAEAEEARSRITNQLAKTAATLFRQYSDLEREMEEEGEIIKIHRDAMRKAFDKAISNSKNERERELINSLLNEMEDYQIS